MPLLWVEHKKKLYYTWINRSALLQKFLIAYLTTINGKWMDHCLVHNISPVNKAVDCCQLSMLKFESDLKHQINGLFCWETSAINWIYIVQMLNYLSLIVHLLILWMLTKLQLWKQQYTDEQNPEWIILPPWQILYCVFWPHFVTSRDREWSL